MTAIYGFTTDDLRRELDRANVFYLLSIDAITDDEATQAILDLEEREEQP